MNNRGWGMKRQHLSHLRWCWSSVDCTDPWWRRTSHTGEPHLPWGEKQATDILVTLWRLWTSFSFPCTRAQQNFTHPLHRKFDVGKKITSGSFDCTLWRLETADFLRREFPRSQPVDTRESTRRAEPECTRTLPGRRTPARTRPLCQKHAQNSSVNSTSTIPHHDLKHLRPGQIRLTKSVVKCCTLILEDSQSYTGSCRQNSFNLPLPQQKKTAAPLDAALRKREQNFLKGGSTADELLYLRIQYFVSLVM